MLSVVGKGAPAPVTRVFFGIARWDVDRERTGDNVGPSGVEGASDAACGMACFEE